VLREEQEVTAKVLAVQPSAVRRTAYVDALRAGEEDDLPACLVEAEAPVRLLAEQEVVLVAVSDLLHRGAAEQHAGAHHHLDLANLVVIEASGVEGVQGRGAGRELAQEEVLGREPPHRGVAADGALECAVRVQEPWPDDRRPRPRVRERDDPVDRARDEPCVRVEEECIRARRLAETEVPAGAQATILGLDDPHVRIPLAHEGDRAVTRAVVDDDGLHSHERVEALLDPGERVVGHDDGRDAIAVSHARSPGAGHAGDPRGA
jgi:hypothetical protein